MREHVRPVTREEALGSDSPYDFEGRDAAALRLVARRAARVADPLQYLAAGDEESADDGRYEVIDWHEELFAGRPQAAPKSPASAWRDRRRSLSEQRPAAGAGLVQQLFRGTERGRVFGAIIGIATAIRPTVGGLLIAVGGAADDTNEEHLMNDRRCEGAMM